MKFIKRFFIVLIAIIVTLVVLAYVFNVDYLLKAVRTIYFNGHKTAFLEDYKYFDNRTIEKNIAQPWAIAKDYNSVDPTKELLQMHQKIGSVAFLIIKND